MTITRFDELAPLADGTPVEVEGRYERWCPWPPPPAPLPGARIVLVGGGVMVGRYLHPESQRPVHELERLDGATVRLTGSWWRTRPWTDPGPIPGIWTGGGPQLVDVGAPSLVTPAPARAAPITAPPPALPEAARPLPSVPTGGRAATARPLGRLARRSLAHGVSRAPALLVPLFALAAAAAVFAACEFAATTDTDTSFLLAALASLAIGWVTDASLTRMLATREVRALSNDPWPFDHATYLAALDVQAVHGILRVRIDFDAPVDAAARETIAATPALRGTTIRWLDDHTLEIECPPVASSSSAGPRTPVVPTNAGIHRWFRRLRGHVLEPLHRRGHRGRVSARVGL